MPKNDSTEVDTLDVNRIVAELTVSTAKEVIKNVGSIISMTSDKLSDLFSNIYKDYLIQTYSKVSTIKTFINPQKPIDLYDNFVSLNLKNGSAIVDEVEFIEKLKPGKKVVISALAGRGKSVLMKYIALSKYHAPDGRIPIFLELRNLNSLTKKDILYYLHNTYKGDKRLSYEKFISYLNSGAFLLIFDGFDEVNPADRDDIENQILIISRKHPEVTIIISGRPDEKFNSWSNFNHYSILPMTIEQVEDLVSKLDYDHALKNKFMKQVKGSLFESHDSFLSTPLLATLMLLTFEQYADIPNKLHVFYDNAFETLFKKHDAMKEQYIRSTRSNLPVDVFRKVFSGFCAISYSDSVYSFSREHILSDINKSLNYYQNPCNPEQFLSDLVESVCLIQLEGFEYHFVHRSFQEYFCALFLAKADKTTRIKFLEESAKIYGDNVLLMLFDMAQEILEKEWILETVERCISQIDMNGGEPIDALMQEVKSITIHFSDGGARVRLWHLGALQSEMRILRTLYNSYFIGTGIHDVIGISRISEEPKSARKFRSIIEPLIAEDKRFKKVRNNPTDDSVELTVDLNRNDKQWLEDVGILSNSKNILRALNEIQSDLVARTKSRRNFLEDLF